MAFAPREWQKATLAKCVKHYTKDGGREFLLVACPGAGKTMASLLCAREFLKRGIVERVCVVTPSVSLRQQWVRKCREVGIDALPLGSVGQLAQTPLPLSVPGLVTSYQQVNRPALMSEWVTERPTFVILDEIHHCAESKSWGDAVAEAFAKSTYRMCLSGTPFREDSNPIPFVFYDPYNKHECVAHETYGYETAIRDGVCRPAEFPWFDGLHEWEMAGVRRAATFDDEIPEELWPRRLAAATDAHTDTMRRMIESAHERLSAVRRRGGLHARAGGLCIGRSDAHVRELSLLLRSVTGEEPVVVHQNVPDAHRLIEDFAAGVQPWIVAIKMISEGVDIPRLRVGVYASNITTSLFFRQFVGRFVRVEQSASDERAYVLIPGDGKLKDIAAEIEKEKCHALGLEYRGLGRAEALPRGRGARREFRVVGSDGSHCGTIVGHENIRPEEITKAAEFRQRWPGQFAHYSDAQLVLVIRAVGRGEPAVA